ncbi:MAG: hypothetical protein OWS74_08775, partial [Firmicutes bacterium]|nr:hypothetical protein [Bacillota bacterium]
IVSYKRRRKGMHPIPLNKAIRTRRFWLAVVYAVLIILTKGMNYSLPTSEIMALAAIVLSLILGDVYVESQQLHYQHELDKLFGPAPHDDDALYVDTASKKSPAAKD